MGFLIEKGRVLQAYRHLKIFGNRGGTETRRCKPGITFSASPPITWLSAILD